MGNFLGFDFGTRFIGVAVGQKITRTAKPLTCLDAHNGVPHWPKLNEIIHQWQPQALITGVPVNIEETAVLARRFIKQLEAHYHLPVYWVDEHLTTVEARAQLFSAKGYRNLEKKKVDSFSAKLILEDWLLNN